MSTRRPRRARRPRSTNGGLSTPSPELARQATRRRGELARVLEWLAGQAGRLEDPATLERVSRAVDRARALVDDLQRDLERETSEREDRGER